MTMHVRSIIARLKQAVQLLCLAMGIGLLACYDVVEPTSRLNLLTIDAPDSSRADGSSLVSVTATIDTLVPAAQRSVTFTTTAGKFIANGTVTIALQADAQGKATTVLQSPTDAGVAVLTASAAGGVRTRNIRFVSTPPAVVSLKAPDSVPADGTTITEVVAQIDTSVKGIPRIVTFTTTAGKFAGTGATSASVSPDVSGRASILLIAPLDPVQAIVSVTMGTTTLYRTLQFVQTQPASIQLSPSALSLQAGPGNELMLTAVVRRAAGPPLQSIRVKFSASDSTDKRPIGIFSPSPLTDANGSASVRYTTSDTTYKGLVLIRSIVEGVQGVRDSTYIVVKR